MTTKRDEQMSKEELADLQASYIEGISSDFELKHLHLTVKAVFSRGYEHGFLAGRESLRSELKLTNNEQKEIDYARQPNRLERHEIESLLAIIDRLTAQESE